MTSRKTKTTATAPDAPEQAVADWKAERDHVTDPSEYSDEENGESERLFREELVDELAEEPAPVAKTKTAKAKAAPRECACGCGRTTKATFAQGHDSVLKSALLKQARAGDESARTQLITRRWATEESIDAPAKAQAAKAKAGKGGA